MALTRLQLPREITAVNQKLIYTYSSTNVGEPGFRYKFNIEVFNGLVSVAEFNIYVQPNPSNRGILDISPIINKIPFVDILNESQTGILHTSISSSSGYERNIYNMVRVFVRVSEAWEVGGVLTDDPDELGSDDTDFDCFDASFQSRFGYRPANTVLSNHPNAIVALTALPDMDVFRWQMAASYGIYVANFVPVKLNNWGCMAFLNDSSIFDGMEYKLFNGSTQLGGTWIFGLPTTGGSTINELFYFAAYPKTLSQMVIFTVPGFDAPDDQVEWTHYTLTLTLDGVAQSKPYVMFKECETRYENRRIGFTNNIGGWDYINFDGKSTISFEKDNKMYRQPLGTYSGETYGFQTWDRGETEFSSDVTRQLTVTKNNLNGSDYRLLEALMLSDNVMLIPDGPSPVIESVVLETKNLDIDAMRRSGQKDIVLRFKFANQVWT